MSTLIKTAEIVYPIGILVASHLVNACVFIFNTPLHSHLLRVLLPASAIFLQGSLNYHLTSAYLVF